jgi:hypothetical protein
MGAIGFIPDMGFIGFIVDCFVKAAGPSEKEPQHGFMFTLGRIDFAKVDAAAYLRKSPF